MPFAPLLNNMLGWTMGRKRQVRWVWVLAVVLLLHGVLVWGLMRQKRSNPSLATERGQMVQAQLSVPVASSMADAPKQSDGADNHVRQSDLPAAKTSSDHAPVKSVTHMPNASSGAVAVSSTDKKSSSAAPITGNISSPQSQASTSAAHAGGSTQLSGSGASSDAASAMSGSGVDSGGTATGAAVDCLATVPARGSAAGLDVAVWVERTSSGARFVSLVNQAGEGVRYLREIRDVAANVRFVAHDPSCVGKKVKVRVRVVF